MKKIIINSSIWDDNEHTMTIRPDSEKKWMDVPFGPLMSKKDADIIRPWLQGAIDTLQMWILKIENDPEVK